MNDRELLELAANAAGVEGEYESWTGQGFKEGIRQVLNGSKCARPWNPLDDDGEALRLAVKLNIMVNVGQVKAGAEWWVRPEMDEIDGVSEPHNGDPYAATRRAIVRAAAEIGRLMT